MAGSSSSVLRKSRTTQISILACLAITGALVWGFAAAKNSSSDDETRYLVASLTESIRERRSDSTGIRVALFCPSQQEKFEDGPLEQVLDGDPKCHWKHVFPDEVRDGDLKGYDVVIFPGGSGSAMAHVLQPDGCEAVRRFVRGGGGYVGICGGAFLATAKYDWSLGIVNAKTLTGTREVPGHGSVSVVARGSATVSVEPTEHGQKVLGCGPGLLNMAYTGGPILSPAGIRRLPPYAELAAYRTETWTYEFQRDTMINTPAIVAARFGLGRVILFGPHPEMSKGLEELVVTGIMAVSQ